MGRRKIKHPKTVDVNVRFTKKQTQAMDSLIDATDKYNTRSDFVRDAVDKLICQFSEPSSYSSSHAGAVAT